MIQPQLYLSQLRLQLPAARLFQAVARLLTNKTMARGFNPQVLQALRRSVLSTPVQQHMAIGLQ